MPPDVLPLGLGEAARRLYVTPDELVRICVLHGRVPDRWTFDPTTLGALAEIGGLLRLQPEPAPADADTALATAVGALLDGGYLEGTRVRADALWRGLDEDTAQTVREGVQRLLGHGLLLRGPGGGPLEVSVPREAKKKLERLVAGKTTLDGLVPA